MFRPLIAGPPAAPSHLVFPAGQPGQEFADPLLHRRPAAQAQIASGLLSRPTPDSLIGVEVRAVAGQVHQPQLQLRRPEVLPHRLPTMGRRIVPDDPQRPWMLFLQLRQEGNRGPAVAVALQFHPFHLARLQAHRRIVAGLLPQDGVLRHEGLPLGLISLEQPLLGTLEGKPQPVKPVQATAAAQADAEPF